jgi:hypothetical protein
MGQGWVHFGVMSDVTDPVGVMSDEWIVDCRLMIVD